MKFETACFEKVKPETAYWEKCGYRHKEESFLIGATCSKCNNYKEFEGRKTENGVIDFDYTKIDAFCSVCGAEMSNAKTETSNEPVKEKYPYYSYNTDINGKEGKYKIVFETDDRSGYRQLEEYIRENFIDKKVTQAHSSYGFLGFGKCLKCGNTYTCTSENPLRYCMACGVEWS